VAKCPHFCPSQQGDPCREIAGKRSFCKLIPTLNNINMNHIQYPADYILFYKEMTLSTGASHLPVKLLSAPWQGGKFEAETRNHPAAVRILGA